MHVDPPLHGMGWALGRASDEQGPAAGRRGLCPLTHSLRAQLLALLDHHKVNTQADGKQETHLGPYHHHQFETSVDTQHTHTCSDEGAGAGASKGL